MIGGFELQAQDEQESELTGWYNSTELSVVVTDGNSRTETFGLRNTLRRTWSRSRFQLKLDGLRSDTADDRFVLLEPGLTWQPGARPPSGSFSIVEPDVEPDVERYFAEGTYERKITDRLAWHAGGSWERNEDAGINNLYIVFGGLGHTWWDKKDLRFSTSYGLSYTDREEDTVDPEKDDNFAGLRFSWDYMNGFGKSAIYENDFTSNVSVKDISDYTLKMDNSITVSMTSHLALKVSLQWIYSNEPALEEVDVVAFVVLVDPDGTPGNGDEFFQTVGSGGGEIEVGDADIRKDEIDTIFRTSLVINF
jgi:hypothetical protein